MTSITDPTKLSWFAKSFKNTIYISIKPEWVKIYFFEIDHIIEDSPTVAYYSPNKPVSIGREAEKNKAQDRNNELRLFNGFQHPRLIIHDHLSAEDMLKTCFRPVKRKCWYRFKPSIMFHVLDDYEGGITPVERQSFRVLGENLGAKDVFICNWLHEFSKQETQALCHSVTTKTFNRFQNEEDFKNHYKL